MTGRFAPPSAHPWDQPGSKNSSPSSERASGLQMASKVGDIGLGFDAGILPWARQNKQINMEVCGTVDLGGPHGGGHTTGP